MKVFNKALLLVGAVVATGGVASAAPVVLSGNYLQVGISDFGTFGSDGNTSPGILHDPTGMRNYGVNDYLTPGTPHDGFTLAANEFYSTNDNNNGFNFGSRSPTLLTGADALGYAHAASWTGSNGYVQLTNSYFFNDGDQRVMVKTTVTALGAVTNVAFARSTDPDPDVNTFGSFDTVNQRGNASFGVNDFVSGSGSNTGLTLALVNLDAAGYDHTTQINNSCCNNISPYDVLNHTGGDLGDNATGDYGLNLAYYIGDLNRGDTFTLTYAYAVGANVDSTGMTGTPEPATWAMMVLGFGAVGGALRRRTTKLRFA